MYDSNNRRCRKSRGDEDEGKKVMMFGPSGRGKAKSYYSPRSSAVAVAEVIEKVGTRIRSLEAFQGPRNEQSGSQVPNRKGVGRWGRLEPESWA
jgi:hypothetical protein